MALTICSYLWHLGRKNKRVQNLTSHTLSAETAQHLPVQHHLLRSIPHCHAYVQQHWDINTPQDTLSFTQSIFWNRKGDLKSLEKQESHSWLCCPRQSVRLHLCNQNRMIVLDKAPFLVHLWFYSNNNNYAREVTIHSSGTKLWESMPLPHLTCH